jgi:hypothetical protein
MDDLTTRLSALSLTTLYFMLRVLEYLDQGAYPLQPVTASLPIGLSH